MSMYCVYMSEEHLADEEPGELYGQFIDENYRWRKEELEDTQSGDPDFLREDASVDARLLTGEGAGDR